MPLLLLLMISACASQSQELSAAQRDAQIHREILSAYAQAVDLSDHEKEVLLRRGMKSLKEDGIIGMTSNDVEEYMNERGFKCVHFSDKKPYYDNYIGLCYIDLDVFEMVTEYTISYQFYGELDNGFVAKVNPMLSSQTP